MMKPQPLETLQVRTPALTPAACGCAPKVTMPTAAIAATMAQRDILVIKLSLQFISWSDRDESRAKPPKAHVHGQAGHPSACPPSTNDRLPTPPWCAPGAPRAGPVRTG